MPLNFALAGQPTVREFVDARTKVTLTSVELELWVFKKGEDPWERRGGPNQRWEQRLGTRSPSENLGTKTMLKSQMRREGMEAERGQRRTNPGQGREVGGVRMWGQGA